MTHEPTPPAPLTDTTLAAIEAALEAASPAPWEYDDRGDRIISVPLVDNVTDYVDHEADAALIVLLRNNAADLVAALREARAVNERLTRLAFKVAQHLREGDFARVDNDIVLALGRIYDDAPDEWLDAAPGDDGGQP